MLKNIIQMCTSFHHQDVCYMWLERLTVLEARLSVFGGVGLGALIKLPKSVCIDPKTFADVKVGGDGGLLFLNVLIVEFDGGTVEVLSTGDRLSTILLSAFSGLIAD